VVGFTTLSSDLEPKLLIEELSDIFTNFDMIIDRYDCQRIKTIGDAYLCVSGMPVADSLHAHNLLNAALEIVQYLHKRNETSAISWQIRVGINSGPVVGGIVGIKKYLYDVFGDTINTASRMESNSDPMKINISENTWQLVKDDFKIVPRGEFEVKGKGAMRMFFVEDRL
jgi:class 3 adenylate cyclase